jgi:hypothetical protein
VRYLHPLTCREDPEEEQMNMNKLVALIGCGITLLSGCGGSSGDGTQSGTGALAAASTTSANNAVHCRSAALEVATDVDNAGWGQGGPALHVASGKRLDGLGNETFQIDSMSSHFTYTVDVLHNAKSNSCVINSILSGIPMTPVIGENKSIQCEKTVLDAATKIDIKGWGVDKDGNVAVCSRVRDESRQTEEFKLVATGSGFTYTVIAFQDPKSQACIISGVTTEITDLAPITCDLVLGE